MKNLVKTLWVIVAISVLFFVLVVLIADSYYIKWQVFSITMPLIGICMWSAIIITLIRIFSSKKK